MLSPGNGFFLQLVNATSGERSLHPATVMSSDNGLFTAESDEKEFLLEAGENVLLFFERNREFMQQPARIEMIMQDDPKLLFGFTTTAEAISAETRQCYRVLTTFANLTIMLNGEECALTDVCTHGFSAVSNAHLQIGDPVDALIDFQRMCYEGQACVQSQKKLASGQIRYGFRTIKAPGVHTALEKGLLQITMEIQRQQLRRLAGA